MYSKPITHIHRTAFVLLVDCSTSMRERTSFNTMPLSKADAVALVCNFLLDELLERATRGQEVRNYYDIAVLGYADTKVWSLLPNEGEDFIPINRLAKIAPEPVSRCFDQSIDGGTTSAYFTLRPWLTPKAEGNTPMHMALTHAYMLIDKWCEKPENRDSFPPIVFNITDGNATDAQPQELINIANCIKNTKTEDGNTLLINVRLGDMYSDTSMIFPSDCTLYDSAERQSTLFNMSSVLPRSFEPYIATIINHKDAGPYRGLALNASPGELLSILNIGTESVNII